MSRIFMTGINNDLTYRTFRADVDKKNSPPLTKPLTCTQARDLAWKIPGISKVEAKASGKSIVLDVTAKKHIPYKGEEATVQSYAQMVQDKIGTKHSGYSYDAQFMADNGPTISFRLVITRP